MEAVAGSRPADRHSASAPAQPATQLAAATGRKAGLARGSARLPPGPNTKARPRLERPKPTRARPMAPAAKLWPHGTRHDPDSPAHQRSDAGLRPSPRTADRQRPAYPDARTLQPSREASPALIRAAGTHAWRSAPLALTIMDLVCLEPRRRPSFSPRCEWPTDVTESAQSA